MEQKYLDKIRNINEVKISYNDTFYDFQQKFNTTQNFLQVYNTIDEKLSDNAITITPNTMDIITMNNINNLTIDSTKVSYEVSNYQQYNGGEQYSYINYFTAGDTKIQIVKQQIIRSDKTYVFTLYSKLNGIFKSFYVGFSDGLYHGEFTTDVILLTSNNTYDLECYVKNQTPYFNVIIKSDTLTKIKLYKITYPSIAPGNAYVIPSATVMILHNLSSTKKLISYYHDKQSNKITYFNHWEVNSVILFVC